ncbi:hypothetical protein M9458_053298, partial [Cirrhinus mrigala]
LLHIWPICPIPHLAPGLVSELWPHGQPVSIRRQVVTTDASNLGWSTLLEGNLAAMSAYLLP